LNIEVLMARLLPFSVIALLLVSVPAVAHPGHGTTASGFAAGILHPLLGVDHVLGNPALGAWVRARLQRSGTLLAALAFPVFMVAGFTTAASGIQVPAVDAGIAASVLVLGLLLAVVRPLPLAAGAGLVALFALLHGYAHGVEFGSVPARYVAGFLIASLLLLAAGSLLGRVLTPLQRRGPRRVVGLLLSATGALLLGAMP
jgi:urease accessory protein